MIEPNRAATNGRPSRVLSTVVVCGVVIMAPVLVGGAFFWARHHSDRGPDVDGVLWRQVASVEDPFSRSLHSPTVGTVTDLLDTLDGDRWDGDPVSADTVDLSRPALLIHDIEAGTHTVAFRVFVSSGERAASPGEGRLPREPSAYFTCYGVSVTFADSSPPSTTRADERACPSLLVSRMPPGAAYMHPSTFDG